MPEGDNRPRQVQVGLQFIWLMSHMDSGGAEGKRLFVRKAPVRSCVVPRQPSQRCPYQIVPVETSETSRESINIGAAVK